VIWRRRGGSFLRMAGWARRRLRWCGERAVRGAGCGDEAGEGPGAGGSHAAMMSAAKILAKKLGLDEGVIATYDGAPKAAEGAVVLALAADSSGRLPVTEHPKRDGYTVTYTGGMVVWGARPRSLLFAAGEPHHWVGAHTAPYRRNPEFALRNATYHEDYPWRSRRRSLARTLCGEPARGAGAAGAAGGVWRVERNGPEEFGGERRGAQGAQCGAGEGVQGRGRGGVRAAAVR